MDNPMDRVLAYDLALDLETDPPEEITGGGVSINIPTMHPTMYNGVSFDMNFEH